MSRLLVASLLLGSFALSACSSGSDTAPAARIVGKNNPSACKYQANVGGRALTENLNRSNVVTSDFFGIPYNRADLEAVLGASGAETAAYIKLRGVELYKIPYVGADDRCLFEDGLESAPQDLQDYWKRRSGGRLDDAQNGLDGLWIYFNYSNGTNSEAIMVRASSDRWTLTHELMHSVFNEERVARNEPSSKATAQRISGLRSAITSDLIRYNSSQSEVTLMNVINNYDVLSKLLLQTLVDSSLEEIADESLLLEEWAAKRLTYVTDQSAFSAAQYIESSRQSSTEDLKLLFTQIENDVTKEAYARGWTAVSEKAAQVQEFLSGIDKRTRELELRAQVLTASLDVKSARRFDMASEANMNQHLTHMIDLNPAVKSYRDLMKSIQATNTTIDAMNSRRRK